MTSTEDTTPETKDAAVEQVHSALDSVEQAFRDAFGTLSDKVKTLLGHLHKQAEGVDATIEDDLKADVAEAESDVKTITVTGQSATGGGVNPNAVHPTTPTANPPVQTETQQVVPPSATANN